MNSSRMTHIGDEFDRVLEAYWKAESIDYHEQSMLINLTNAYRADRAADKQRIAELEEALKLATHWLDDEVPPYVIRQLKEVLPRGDA